MHNSNTPFKTPENRGKLMGGIVRKKKIFAKHFLPPMFGCLAGNTE